MADLLMGYPAFAFALATEYGRKGDADEVMSLLQAGESSKKLADLYGLPRWLRKLPPEAFLRHIPIFNTSDAFHCRLANFVPSNPKIATQWFLWVMKALEVEGEEFALWLAAQALFKKQESLPTHGLLAPLILFYWYSTKGADTLGAAGLRRKWTPKMSLSNALESAGSWLATINQPYFQDLQELERKKEGLTREEEVRRNWGPWIKGAGFMGYQFVALMNARALAKEGQAMHHCVATYAGLVADGVCCIYSVRDKYKNRVATLELRHRSASPGEAEIIQIQGRSNTKPSAEIMMACTGWLERYGDVELPPPPHSLGGVGQHRTSHWEAYWEDKPVAWRSVNQWHWDNPAFLENTLTRLRGLAS